MKTWIKWISVEDCYRHVYLNPVSKELILRILFILQNEITGTAGAVKTD